MLRNSTLGLGPIKSSGRSNLNFTSNFPSISGELILDREILNYHFVAKSL
jgi:hypothetical protein